MSPERWRQASRILESTFERDPSRRAAYIAEVCAGDEELRREVESLLAASERAGSLLDATAMGMAAPLFVEGPAELMPGQAIGHYNVVTALGTGGMGDVYLADDTRLGRRVALKLLPHPFTTDQDRLRRFVQEARAASALNHPNVCVIYEVGETADDRHYIAMEYVEGVTLRQRMAETRLSVSEVLDISVQVTSALTAAHAAGIVHRDIKPENIIVRPDGLVKVLDFGLAKLVQTHGVNAEAAMLINTSPGTVMGTVAYMSPDQARGKEVDARTDVFSLGVVLYEMLSGRVPFAGETASDMIAAILKAEPATLDEDTSPELQHIVSKTLQKNVDERYQTVKDLLIDLKSLQHDLDFTAELERSGKRTEPDQPATTQDQGVRTASSAEYIASGIRQHKRGFTTALAVLLLAALGFGYWFYMHRPLTTIQIESIAVLPFVNEGGNADMEYLSDGMTESLIGSLSQLPNLNVKARSSVFRYKGKGTDAHTIGKELNVQAILNGRVIQRGEQLTLGLELVDAWTENVIWSELYDRKRGDLVALQREVARDVANKLRTRLSGTEQQGLTKNYTENAEAYQLYLRGRYHWYKFPAKEFEKSRDYFQQAIDVDPNYALAHAGLAEYYGFGAANGFLPPSSENWSKSEVWAKRALALDNTLPDAYNALAGVKQFHDDLAGAERELKRVIELNPNYAVGRSHYAYLLIHAGRSEEAVTQMKKALELEPLSVPFNRGLAMIFYLSRQYDRAVEQYQKALELDPNDAFIHELLGDAYEQKGMQKEAVTEWSRALTLTGANEVATMLERTFAASDFNAAVRTLWQKKLERFNEKARRGEYVPAMNYARAYTGLADKEQAFAWLSKAEQERNALIDAVKLDAVYDPLRSDPRFAELMRRVGLPQ